LVERVIGRIESFQTEPRVGGLFIAGKHPPPQPSPGVPGEGIRERVGEFRGSLVDGGSGFFEIAVVDGA
jgi:hypothetical protein